MFTPVIGTLAYILSPDRRSVLMVERTRDGDAHQGKCNGLGGKLEPGEDVVACIRRELWEEAGIVPTVVRLRGTISWPGFGAHGEDWFGFIFVVDEFVGDPPAANADGPLRWVPVDEVTDLPLWEGDRYFLPLVFGDGPVFHGVMPYVDGRPAGWSYSTG